MKKDEKITVKVNPELEILNGVETWSRGVFILPPADINLTDDQIQRRKAREERLVKAAIDGGHLCQAQSKDAAEWICGRLNLLSKLQKMARSVFLDQESNPDNFMELILSELVGLEEESDGE
jgi:hypothetical protein